jgi:apolipoprotein N-acyltransferase
VSGHRPGVLALGKIKVGDVICFEVAYDGLVRDVVTHGGQLIAVQTNNATFGHSAETWQQLAMGRLRAIEHDRAVVIAATSGVSAVISPTGHIVTQSAIFRPAVLDERIPLVSARTTADRLGETPEWALCTVALGSVCAAAGATMRRRRGRARG